MTFKHRNLIGQKVLHIFQTHRGEVDSEQTLMLTFIYVIHAAINRKNIWHAGHHKTIANFKSVAYVHNRCRSKYNLYIYSQTSLVIYHLWIALFRG